MSDRSKSKTFALVLLIAAFGLNACAALQPTDTSGPRSNVPPYPIPAEKDSAEAATLTWHQLLQRNGLPLESAPDLQPLTGTIRSIPPNLGGFIDLPKVGTGPTQTEEQTRESLRRFIDEWRSLLGADPAQLSLVERTDESSGIKVARYEQRPFRIPLRGSFGTLVIRFQSNRRVIDVTSTCLPNTDRLQPALSALTPKVTPEDAAKLVRDQSFTVSGPSSQQQSFRLPPGSQIDVHQLVAYVIRSSDLQSIELHLAWEIDVTNGPIKTIYLDAISETVIAVS